MVIRVLFDIFRYGLVYNLFEEAWSCHCLNRIIEGVYDNLQIHLWLLLGNVFISIVSSSPALLSLGKFPAQQILVVEAVTFPIVKINYFATTSAILDHHLTLSIRKSVTIGSSRHGRRPVYLEL